MGRRVSYAGYCRKLGIKALKVMLYKAARFFHKKKIPTEYSMCSKWLKNSGAFDSVAEDYQSNYVFRLARNHIVPYTYNVNENIQEWHDLPGSDLV